MSFYRIGQDGRKYWGKSGAGILFTDGKTILLLKRSNETDQGDKWCLPGGKTETGETPIETARRESKEETGCVKGYKFAQWTEKDGHHIFHVFGFKVDEPFDVVLSDEHTDWKWVPMKEIKNLSLHPEFKKNFDYYKEAIDKKFVKSENRLRFGRFLIEQEVSCYNKDSVWQFICETQDEVPALPPKTVYDKVKQTVVHSVMDKVGDLALDTTPGLIGNVLKVVFAKGGSLLRKMFIGLPQNPVTPGQMKDYELADRRRDETGQQFGVMTKFLGGVAISAVYYSLLIGLPYMLGRAEVSQLQQKIKQLEKQVAALPPDQQKMGQQIANEVKTTKTNKATNTGTIFNSNQYGRLEMERTSSFANPNGGVYFSNLTVAVQNGQGLEKIGSWKDIPPNLQLDLLKCFEESLKSIPANKNMKFKINNDPNDREHMKFDRDSIILYPDPRASVESTKEGLTLRVSIYSK